MSRFIEQYNALKSKFEDSAIIFRCANFYIAYNEDAVRIAEVLGLKLIESNHVKRGNNVTIVTNVSVKQCEFPRFMDEVYFRKLTHNGIRLAICDDSQLASQRVTHTRIHNAK